MSDTQWPRYEVFVQERPGGVYEESGSVHAADGEMAFLNARDVFVRRPEVSSMWVVPAHAIFSRTGEELRNTPLAPVSDDHLDAKQESYWVAAKRKSAGLICIEEQVEASSPAEALETVLQKQGLPGPVFVWWVFPASRVIANNPDDVDSLFAPARDKTFRLSSDFRTVSAMRQIRKRPEEGQLNSGVEEGESCER